MFLITFWNLNFTNKFCWRILSSTWAEVTQSKAIENKSIFRQFAFEWGEFRKCNHTAVFNILRVLSNDKAED